MGWDGCPLVLGLVVEDTPTKFSCVWLQGRMAGHWLCAGRPVCDVRISAKELIRAKSYDLAGMCECISLQET